jgi:radical SAM-linked protein
MDPVSVLAEKNKFIKNSLEFCKNVSVAYRDSRITRLETILARGDRSVGRLLYHAWELGAKLDGWEEHFNMDTWEKAAADIGMDLDRYTAPFSTQEPAPWEAVNLGVGRDFLLREREKALTGEVTADCRSKVCCACGICKIVPRQLIAKSDGPEKSLLPNDRKRPGKNDIPKNQFFYRMVYRKGHDVRFLGHRDMVSVFQRAFVAAGIPLDYSEGFHAHPRISFGPPLALGIAGEAELFDIVTTQPLSIGPQTINGWLPTDLEIINIQPCTQKQQSLSGTMAAGRYYISPLKTELVNMISQSVDAFLAKEEILIRTVKDKVEKIKNIRPLVYEIKVDNKEKGGLQAVLSHDPIKNCSPSELVSALFPGFVLGDFFIVRTACLHRENGVLVPF